MKPIVLKPAQLRTAEVFFWLGLASCYFLLPEHLSLMSQILIFGLFAVSLDMALGYAGILTVGHAAFFGAGAYAAGLLAKHGWGEPFSGLLVALLVCVALGYLLSYLVVRGTDLARLMITIGVCMLLAELANRLSGITGGTDGPQGTVQLLFGSFEFDLVRRPLAHAFHGASLSLGVWLILRSLVCARGIHDSRKRMLAIGSPVDAPAWPGGCRRRGRRAARCRQTTQFVTSTDRFNRWPDPDHPRAACLWRPDRLIATPPGMTGSSTRTRSTGSSGWPFSSQVLRPRGLFCGARACPT